MSNAKVYFFSMGSGCGHCVNTEKLLAKEISNGEVIKKHYSEASEARGFPYFTSIDNPSKTVTGAPSSKEDLYRQLDIIIENFDHGYDEVYGINSVHEDSLYLKQDQLDKDNSYHHSSMCNIPEMFYGVF